MTTPRPVTVYEDSRGVIHRSLAYAEEAEFFYKFSELCKKHEVLKTLKDDLVRVLYKFISSNLKDINECLGNTKNGHLFYVVMQKRQDAQVFEGLHKTDLKIYLEKRDAEEAAEVANCNLTFRPYHVVELIAYTT